MAGADLVVDDRRDPAEGGGLRAAVRHRHRAQAILASNTSSIPIMKLAMATSRPANVIGMHFFNPVPVMNLVEVVTSLLTSDETQTMIGDFAGTALNKRVIHSQDRAGFIVNALLIPYILSAIRMLESGFATAADIDAGMVEGCNHPMGPLALADLIGLDTTMAVAESLYDEFKEQLYAPPPLLARMNEAGLLGRKAGRGFYGYWRIDRRWASMQAQRIAYFMPPEWSADGVRYPPGFPMPRDPSALTDRSRRPIVRRQPRTTIPVPCPQRLVRRCREPALAPRRALHPVRRAGCAVPREWTEHRRWSMPTAPTSERTSASAARWMATASAARSTAGGTTPRAPAPRSPTATPRTSRRRPGSGRIPVSSATT